MTTLSRFLSISSLLFLPLIANASEIKIIHAGELLAIPGQESLKKHSIVITGDKITSVTKGFVNPNDIDKEATLIDLKNSFVMPGMMDMHVHLQGELGPDNAKNTLRMSAEDVGMQSVYFAKKTLMAGFTTVRDLGADPQFLYALRNAVQKGWVEGPRIIASGGVSVTGGHGDVDGMRHDLLELYTPKTICNGPYDCRRATREAIKYGAQVIKITSTGGVLSDTDTGTGQQMEDDELFEIVQTAHGLGRKVASHAHSANGINAALRAGVDSIEHGSYANEESIKLFKKSGAYLVPTLLAGDTVLQMASNSNFLSPAIKAKALQVGADMQVNFEKAYKAGVKIAYGTDSGVSKHGVNAQEAVLMKKSGMPEMDIIKSATINAADLINMSKTLGTIEQGKFADIIAVDKSPIQDIQQLLDVDFVMKSGTVFKK